MSAEGTAAGVAAAGCLAACALALGQVRVVEAGCVVAAAVVANLLESVVGASVQGRAPWLTNDAVNVLQICVAAGVAAWLAARV